jgi:hypothetical protein
MKNWLIASNWCYFIIDNIIIKRGEIILKKFVKRQITYGKTGRKLVIQRSLAFLLRLIHSMEELLYTEITVKGLERGGI